MTTNFIANTGLPGKGSVPRLSPSFIKFFHWFWAQVQVNLQDGEMGLSSELATLPDFIKSLMMLGMLLKTLVLGILCKKLKFCLKKSKTSIACKHSANLRHEFYRPSEVTRKELYTAYHLILLSFGKCIYDLLNIWY